MSLLDKCKAILTDPHPERDETHSATREAMNPLHCPPWPCPGANPALCGVCTDTRKPLSVAKPLYERELPLVDTPAQDTLAQKFAAYDEAHPEVWQAFRDCVDTQIRNGATYISPRDQAPEVRRMVKHGVNNSYWRFYADKYKAKRPSHADVFRERRRPSKKMRLVYAKN